MIEGAAPPVVPIAPPGPPGPPGGVPALSASHWTKVHSLAIVAITGFCVYMAFWTPWGLYPSWLVLMATLATFILIVGHGRTGAWQGALVDERYRISLSRMQMLVWTVVVLSGFGCIAIARAQQNPITAMDIAVPETLWFLMGISTASFIGSPLLKNAKKNPSLALDLRKEHDLLAKHNKTIDTVEVQGHIVSNRSIKDASLADLFTGEEVGNLNNLDLGKVQMFFFTVLLVIAYASALAVALRAGTLPNSLPDVGDGMLPLLGISHAGYLMNKAVPKT